MGIYFIFLLISFIKGISELKNDLLKNIINNKQNSGKYESKEKIKTIKDLINIDLKKQYK